MDDRRRWPRRCAAQVEGALPEAISGLSIDSRRIAPGEAYFAIKGDIPTGMILSMPR